MDGTGWCPLICSFLKGSQVVVLGKGLAPGMGNKQELARTSGPQIPRPIRQGSDVLGGQGMRQGDKGHQVDELEACFSPSLFSCHPRIPQSGYKQRKCVSPTLEAGSLRSDASRAREGAFPRPQTSGFDLTWQSERGPLWSLFYKGTPPSWPQPLPKAPPPNTVTSGIRFSAYEFGGHTNTQTIAASSLGHRAIPCL